MSQFLRINHSVLSPQLPKDNWGCWRCSWMVADEEYPIVVRQKVKAILEAKEVQNAHAVAKTAQQGAESKVGEQQVAETSIDKKANYVNAETQATAPYSKQPDGFTDFEHLKDSDGFTGPDDPDDSDDESPKKKRVSKFRVIRWILFTIGFIVITTFVALVFALRTEQGTRMALEITRKLTNDLVSVKWDSGTLLQGGSAEYVKIHLKYLHVDIDDFSGKWHWKVSPLTLNADDLKAKKVAIKIFPSGKKSKPVQEILMPFVMDLKRVRVDELVIENGLSVTKIEHIDGAAKTDRVQHWVKANRIDFAHAQYQGTWDVNGRRPFAMKADVEIDATFDEKNYQLFVKAKGDLSNLAVSFNAEGGLIKDNQLKGQGTLNVQFLDGFYLHQANLSLEHLNPKALIPFLPTGDLNIKLKTNAISGESLAELSKDKKIKANTKKPMVTGDLIIENLAPDTFIKKAMPFTSAKGDFTFDGTTQKLDNILIKTYQGGDVTGKGLLEKGLGQFDLNLNAYNLLDVDSRLQKTKIDGTLLINVKKDKQEFFAKLKQDALQPNLSIDAEVMLANKKVEIKKLDVSSNEKANLNASGIIDINDVMSFKAQAKLTHFNVQDWAKLPKSDINADFSTDGQFLKSPVYHAQGVLNDSLWAGMPSKGVFDITYKTPEHIEAKKVNLQVGDNTIRANGSLGQENDRMEIELTAPSLKQFGLGMEGKVFVKGTLVGKFTNPRGELTAEVQQFKYLKNQVDSATIRFDWQDLKPDGSINLDFHVKGYRVANVELATMDGTISGTQAAHMINGAVVGKVWPLAQTDQQKSKSKPITLNAQLKGQGKILDKGWQGVFSQVENTGDPYFKILKDMTVTVQNGHVRVENIVGKIEGGNMQIEYVDVKGPEISTKGQAQQIPVQKVFALLNIDLPVYLTDDFAASARWNLELSANPKGNFSISKDKGDISLKGKQVKLLGIHEIELNGAIEGHKILLSGYVNAKNIGQTMIQGQLGLVQTNGIWSISGASPLNLKVNNQINNLQSYNNLLGVNIKLQGQLANQTNITGVLGAPEIEGVLIGTGLDFYHVEQGIRFQDGRIRLRYTQNKVAFEEFEFRAGQGRISASGAASFGDEKNDLTAKLVFDRAEPFIRPDRKLVVSGITNLGFDGNDVVQVEGQLRVDQAKIDLPETLPPSLDNDVVVIHSQKQYEQAAQKSGLKLFMDLTLDLGNQFRFQGQGADVLLSGIVKLSAKPQLPLSAKGSIKVDRGSYVFYGQPLVVQRGLITFQGELINPSINILATRTVGATDVGVELTGTLEQSNARLTSTPEMPDEEKLSWLLFGQSPEMLSGNQYSAIAGAASLLLGSEKGRKITDKLGIDTVTVGTARDGSADTYLGVGKKISDKFSIEYEQGINKLTSVVKLTWQFSQKWKLILRGGGINSIDLQHNRRFDKFRLK